MRRLGLLSVAIATFYLAAPAVAWDATGHRIIAAIAYERLTPRTRARVDQLIAAHPDYLKWVENTPEEPRARARAAFIAAAVWADEIKGDDRFWDDTRKDATPTVILEGYPDMKRHTNWHYFDTPYAPDGAMAEPPPVPNAMEVARLLKEIRHARLSVAAYELPWIEHLTGDLGQPLHCVDRILKAQPKGDAGGNFVFVNPGRNLHAVWDDAAGREVSDAYVTKYAIDAVAAHPAPRRIEKDPMKWIAEAVDIAENDVYSFGNETGARERPISLSPAYLKNARSIAEAQIALAGYRLAAVLNERVK